MWDDNSATCADGLIVSCAIDNIQTLHYFAEFYIIIAGKLVDFMDFLGYISYIISHNKYNKDIATIK